MKLNAEQLALAKEKAKRDTLEKYDTMIGKRSRSFYETRLKAYSEAFKQFETTLAEMA